MVHHEFVSSMLHEGAPVHGIEYRQMDGGGWFTDAAKGLWAKAKNLFSTQVRPVLNNAVSNAGAAAGNTLKNAVTQSIENALRPQARVDRQAPLVAEAKLRQPRPPGMKMIKGLPRHGGKPLVIAPRKA